MNSIADHHWHMLLKPVDLEQKLNLAEKAIKIKSGTSMPARYQRDQSLCPNNPRESRKPEIISLFDKWQDLDQVVALTHLTKRYIRKTLIEAKRIKPAFNWAGRRSVTVIQKTLAGEIIAEFTNISQAARETGIDNEQIRRVCNQDPMRKTAGGYKFEFKWHS